MLLVPVLAIAIGLGAVGIVFHYERTIAWLLLVLALAASAAAIEAYRRFMRGTPLTGLALSALSALLLYWGVYGAGMPYLPTLWPSPRLAAVAKGMQCPAPAFATVGLREPSLVFLVGTQLAMPTAPAAADFLAEGPCRMAFVEKAQEPAFRSRAAALGLSPRLSSVWKASISMAAGGSISASTARPDRAGRP